jgi:hypothetical protein
VQIRGANGLRAVFFFFLPVLPPRTPVVVTIRSNMSVPLPALSWSIALPSSANHASSAVTRGGRALVGVGQGSAAQRPRAAGVGTIHAHTHRNSPLQTPRRTLPSTRDLSIALVPRPSDSPRRTVRTAAAAGTRPPRRERPRRERPRQSRRHRHRRHQQHPLLCRGPRSRRQPHLWPRSRPRSRLGLQARPCHLLCPRPRLRLPSPKNPSSAVTRPLAAAAKQWQQRAQAAAAASSAGSASQSAGHAIEPRGWGRSSAGPLLPCLLPGDVVGVRVKTMEQTTSTVLAPGRQVQPRPVLEHREAAGPQHARW